MIFLWYRKTSTIVQVNSFYSTSDTNPDSFNCSVNPVLVFEIIPESANNFNVGLLVRAHERGMAPDYTMLGLVVHVQF
jgi:hypothetical protein